MQPPFRVKFWSDFELALQGDKKVRLVMLRCCGTLWGLQGSVDCSVCTVFCVLRDPMCVGWFGWQRIIVLWCGATHFVARYLKLLSGQLSVFLTAILSYPFCWWTVCLLCKICNTDGRRTLPCAQVNRNHIGMMEQVVCANAHTFIGTAKSTFTGYITRMRGTWPLLQLVWYCIFPISAVYCSGACVGDMCSCCRF
jgi:hypothetical protein